MPAPSPEVLQSLMGIYRGFTPTDESAVMLGEIEVNLTLSEVRIRTAGGLGIVEEAIPTSELNQLSQAEARRMTDPEVVTDISKVVVLEAGSSFIFVKDVPNDIPGLMIVGGLGDIFGPTMLYNPDQLARGLFEQAVKAIESAYGTAGVIPRLHYNGRALTS